ncbi:MAG: molecular chaperone DnaK, partial [Pseudonocardiales bacterium]|nr:molecular chaperone DnaK [Pseudonocardiales bacterium]
QGITISESANLDQAEVERMVAEAERNRGEDQALREQVDARNELDSSAYQLERLVNELGDSAPVHEKARAEMLISDAREALKNDAPLARVRELTGELQQAAQALRAARQSGSSAGPTQPGEPGGASGAADDDVIDAEFNPA